MMNKSGPFLPVSKPATLEAKKIDLVVMDQSQQAMNPNHHGYKLIQALTTLLDKARRSGLHIDFTNTSMSKGTPDDSIYSGYERKPSEPVIFPERYDKFQPFINYLILPPESLTFLLLPI